jgi:hypothetical protein
LLGSPPQVTRLHPLWPDYRLPLKALDDVLSSHGRVLLVAHDAEPFAHWIVGTPGDVVTLNSDHLLQLTHTQFSEIAGTFDACVLFSGDAMLDQSDALIEHIGPLLKAKGRLILMATNSLSALDATEFSRSFAAQAGRLLNRSVWIEDIQYVELSPRREIIRNAMLRLAARNGRTPLSATAALPVALANYVANGTVRSSSTPPLGAWSSVCLTLRASEETAPYPVRFAREAALARVGLAAAQRPPAPSEALQMPVGLPTQSLQASRLWQDDEARLASHLAHYRFVAAVMGVRHDVAEYGCASPTGTRLILQQSRKMTLFDPRPLVVGDLQWRFEDDWRFEARLHDIISRPLSRQADSAYCIDFLQYISRDEEDIFVRNLRDSLSRDFDFLLIGSPSYGARADIPPGARHAPGVETPVAIAAPVHRPDVACRSPLHHGALTEEPLQTDGLAAGNPRSARGQARIYRRTGAELKALMERFFQNVFMFSMVDDVAQAGIQPNAQHVFALSCGKKD